MTRGIVALVFRWKVVGGHLTETDVTRSFRWVTAAEVNILTSEAFAIRVLDGMRDEHIPAIHHHDGTRLL